MNAYKQAKERAREEAINWQQDFANHNYSYCEMLAYQNHFEKLANRYGLTNEFRENGII